MDRKFTNAALHPHDGIVLPSQAQEQRVICALNVTVFEDETGCRFRSVRAGGGGSSASSAGPSRRTGWKVQAWSMRRASVKLTNSGSKAASLWQSGSARAKSVTSRANVQGLKPISPMRSLRPRSSRTLSSAIQTASHQHPEADPAHVDPTVALVPTQARQELTAYGGALGPDGPLSLSQRLLILFVVQPFISGIRFQSSLRMACNSLRRFGVVFGYSIFRSWSDSRIIWEMMSRAFSLSSAGTTFHGAVSVLVPVKHSS